MSHKYGLGLRLGSLGLATVVALTLAALAIGPVIVLNATRWMTIEIATAVAIALTLGQAATLTTGTRSLPYLNQFVSRGIELTAALPLVLACGVVAVTIAIPVPIAVAIVVGLLDGLRCMRVVASAPPASSHADHRVSARSWWFQGGRRTLTTVVPTVIEQIVGLEAGLAWLGLFDQHWTGGWGEQLGQAARQGQLGPLGLWTLSTVALSMGLKVLYWSEPGAAPAAPEH